MTGPAGSHGPAIDIALLSGFDFACRPGCGLCCYATPAASPEEQHRLLQIDPDVHFVGGSGGFRMVPARPDGGACRFLAQERCTVHEARPFPCREYPLSVHVAARWQASVVLTCPGVRARDLSAWRGPAVPVAAPRGLDDEIAAAQQEAGDGAGTGFEGADRRWRRALRAEGIGEDPSTLVDLRSEAAALGTFPEDEDLLSLELPEAAEGLSFLPLFLDPRFGRVALAASEDGIDLLRLREAGGVEERLAELAPPSRLPRWVDGADDVLEGYLSYVLRRDAFVGAVLEDRGQEPLAERLALELRSVGAEVVARGVWRAQLGGGDGGSLDVEQLWDGIRATDSDLVDRPTIGAFL
jgi:Fe-S-cluster containining protein